MPKVIKVGGKLTKFSQKQFLDTGCVVVLVCIVTVVFVLVAAVVVVCVVVVSRSKNVCIVFFVISIVCLYRS